MPMKNNIFIAAPMFVHFWLKSHLKKAFQACLQQNGEVLKLKWSHPKWSSNHRWAIPALKVGWNDKLNHELYTFRVLGPLGFSRALDGNQLRIHTCLDSEGWGKLWWRKLVTDNLWCNQYSLIWQPLGLTKNAIYGSKQKF